MATNLTFGKEFTEQEVSTFIKSNPERIRNLAEELLEVE